MSETAKQELSAARRMAALSMFINFSLALVKGVVGVISGSTALVGDAIHSGADVLASCGAFVGLWVAGRNHPSFPYGLYKAETVATLVTSIVVLLAGYEIGRQAIFGSSRVPDVALALPVTIGCLAVALIFGYIQLQAGRRLNSPALKADARDYLADSLSTTVVLVGLLASTVGLHIDRWAAAGVSLFVFKVGGQLLVSALKDLLDASIDRETELEIRQMVETCPQVTRIKRFLSRTTGGRYMVDMDVILRTPSHQLADKVADRLEKDIPKQFPLVVMARVRPHFSSGQQVRRLLPCQNRQGLPSAHLSSAPFFRLDEIDVRAGAVKQTFHHNPYLDLERQKGFKVGRWLLSLKPDQVVVPEKKESVAVALLEEAGVEILDELVPIKQVLPLYRGDEPGPSGEPLVK